MKPDVSVIVGVDDKTYIVGDQKLLTLKFDFTGWSLWGEDCIGKPEAPYKKFCVIVNGDLIFRWSDDEIIEILNSENQAEHVGTLVGDPILKDSRWRWGWACKCGASCKGFNFTMGEAREDYKKHVEANSG